MDYQFRLYTACIVGNWNISHCYQTLKEKITFELGNGQKVIADGCGRIMT